MVSSIIGTVDVDAKSASMHKLPSLPDYELQEAKLSFALDLLTSGGGALGIPISAS